MRTATLHVTVSPQKRTVFTVQGNAAPATFNGPAIADVDRLREELSKNQSLDSAQRARILRRYAGEFGPGGFNTWLRQWISDPDHDSVLCVHTEDEGLSALPWAEILLPPGAAAGRGCVARVCQPQGSPPPPPEPSAHMLLAGWANITGYPMPGVLRELHEFPGKVDKRQLRVQVLAEATRSQLLRACEKDRVALLHLSPPSFIEDGGVLAIPVSIEHAKTGSSRRRPAPSGVPAFDTVSVADFNEALRKNDVLRMVVVNACQAERACEQISRARGVVSVGWPTMVTDDVASDFTFYFYQRLLEGSTPILAIRSFTKTFGTSQTPVDMPVVWLPSPEWVAWRPLSVTEAAAQAAGPVASVPVGGARTTEAAAASASDSASREASPTGAASSLAEPDVPSVAAMVPTLRGLRLEFRPRASINPALLVNGLYPIEHLSIESPFEQEMHLCIECDTGANTSTFRQTVTLKKGVVPVCTHDIHFPALHELIERHAHRRRISFTATLTTPAGEEVAGQTCTAQWMGAKEWLDQEDTWAFIPAFVNPFDDGVLKVFEFAKRVLRTLGHPSDTFSGYQAPGSEYVSTQMKAIFQTLRDDSVGLTYISPPGSPVYDSSKHACGQVVRSHTEVIERKLGTCHDLALLLAACAEYIGIRPLVCLVPGHTFVGYWLTSEGQDRYWKEREGRLRTGKFGESWTLTDGYELLHLVTQGQVALVEATFVCQRDKTFEEAREYRAEQVKVADKDLLDVAVDIFAARREIQPV